MNGESRGVRRLDGAALRRFAGDLITMATESQRYRGISVLWLCAFVSRWPRSSIAIALVTATLALTTAVAAQRGSADEDVSAYLPPGEGRQLFVPSCAGCHELRSTLQLRQSNEAWETMILDMGARGAPVMVDDVEPLAKYLAAMFGPKAPPFTDVNAATREDLLKVPGVTATGADGLIAARAKKPLASHDDIRAALGMDAPAFEKIRYYLYVKREK